MKNIPKINKKKFEYTCPKGKNLGAYRILEVRGLISTM